MYFISEHEIHLYFKNSFEIVFYFLYRLNFISFFCICKQTVKFTIVRIRHEQLSHIL